MKQELVFQNKYYSVVTGLMAGSELEVPLYKVINRQFDIVEVETTILIRAVSLARDYSEYLDRMEEDDEEDDEDNVQFEIPEDDLEVEVILDDPS